MIYVTQGHERGIGLEVFFKSLISLNLDLNKIILIGFKKSILSTLNTLDISFNVNESFILLNKCKKLQYIEPILNYTETSSCLLHILEKIHLNHNDIIFTLPSSKEEFVLNNNIVNGHTEFFRTYFANNEITMCFKRGNKFILLMSDHIPITHISSYLSEELYISKISKVLDSYNFKAVYISGINPHSGENGLLGSEEIIINNSLNKLRIKYPHITFLGPISGDVVWNSTEDQLIVYAYHDQGLCAFKAVHKLKGINLTLGLPFKRISVDHGTAFNLFGKNISDYSGCLEILREIKKGL